VDGIDWVIVGGESGRKPRKMKEEWVVEIQEQCEALQIPFFFKRVSTFYRIRAEFIDG